MRVWQKQKYKNLTVIALCLLVISGGVAYAGYTNQPTPSGGMTPSTDEELQRFHAAFNDYATHSIQSTNGGNGSAATNAGALVDEHDIIGTHSSARSVQQTYAILDGLIMLVQSQTDAASQSQGASIKARQSEQYVYAAADDLSNAMALAVLNHYGTMNKKQIVAELIEEGKSYGYIPASFNVNAENTKNGFSLIAKALADTGGQKPNNIWAMGSDKGGAPTDAAGTNDQYGVSGPQGDLGIQQDRFRGNIYGAKLAFGAALPDEPDCGKAVASVECDSDMIGNRMLVMREKGPEMKKQMKMAVLNAKVKGGGGGADNSDHSSFFISSAHAQAGGGGVVAQFIQQLQQAQQQSCTAHKPIDELQGQQECQDGNVASALQNKYAQATAACCSGDAQADRAPAMLKTDIIKSINGAAKEAAEVWEDM